MKFSSLILIAIAFLSVAACGGGGGGGGTSPPTAGPPPPPPPPPPSGGQRFDPRDPAGNVYSVAYQPEFNVTLPYPVRWELTIGSSSIQPAVYVDIEEINLNPNHLFDVRIRLSRVAIGEDTLPPRVSVEQVLETNQITVGPHAATETVFDGTEVGVPPDLRFIETAIDIGNERYTILIAMERDNQYQEYGDAMRYLVQRFEIGANVLEAERLEDPGSAAIATNGSDFLTVACLPDPGNSFFRGTLVAQRFRGAAERIGDEIVIEDERVRCRTASPVVSWDGNNYLVSYIKNVDLDIRVNGQVVDNDQLSVVGKRVSPAGEILDADPLLISTFGTFQETNRFRNKPAAWPTAAFDGARHIIVWDQTANPDTTEIENIRQIHGAFVSPDGTVSDNFVINDELIGLYGPSSYFYWRGDIAVGTDRILVVVGPRSEPASLSAPSPVFAEMIDFSGNLMSADPILIREDPGDQNPRHAQAAFDGNDFLVAWIEGTQIESSLNDGEYGIFARKIAADGTLINGDPSTTGFEVVAKEEIPREYLDLYFSRGEYLVVWSAIRGAIEKGVWGTRFAADLSSAEEPGPIAGLGTEAAIRFGLEDQEFPAIAENADTGMVIWTYEHFIKSWPLRPSFPEPR